MADLSGRSYIVTGASTGIGAATATLLAQHGANVAISFARNEAAAAETAAACEAAGGEALLVQGDVAEDATCRRIAEATMSRWDRIDGLVNNAGMTKFVDHKNLDGLSAEDFQRIFAVNLIGVFQMTRAVAPHMKAAGQGAIVNVSSVAGVYGVGSSIAYVASKGALNSITLSLARALGPEIRVNAVCPGLVETGFWGDQVDAERKRAIAEHYAATAALKRFSQPEDQARSILFFLDGDPNVTGQVMVSDSGMHLT